MVTLRLEGFECLLPTDPVSVWLQPCFLRDWELQVHFKIHGQGKKNLHGDGLAIWYTKDRMQPGTGDAGLLLVWGWWAYSFLCPLVEKGFPSPLVSVAWGLNPAEHGSHGVISGSLVPPKFPCETWPSGWVRPRLS